MNLDDALQTFVAESRELLENMEAALLAVEHEEARGDLVNAIFRAAHTIKGSAGLFGLDHIVAFTHVVESVLDKVRDGEIAITPELVELLLACRDHIGALIEMTAAGCMAADEEMASAAAPLTERLRACPVAGSKKVTVV